MNFYFVLKFHIQRCLFFVISGLSISSVIILFSWIFLHLCCHHLIFELMLYWRLILLKLCYERKWKCSCSVVSDSLQPRGLLACQAPLSMNFCRQEYWSGLPFLFSRDFLDPGINLGLLHHRQILYHLSHLWKWCYAIAWSKR